MKTHCFCLICQRYIGLNSEILYFLNALAKPFMVSIVITELKYVGSVYKECWIKVRYYLSTTNWMCVVWTPKCFYYQVIWYWIHVLKVALEWNEELKHGFCLKPEPLSIFSSHKVNWFKKGSRRCALYRVNVEHITVPLWLVNSSAVGSAYKPLQSATFL